MKGLEALRQNAKLLEKLANNIGYDVTEIEEDYGFNILDNTSIIEKELKDYENLKLKHRSMQDAVLDDFKKLKALEIIKREPSAVIGIITTYDTWEEYIEDYPLNDKTIWHVIENKIEFLLLKEVFL